MSENTPLSENDQAIEKLNFYLNQIKTNKNKLIIFNATVAVLTLLVLLFIIKPYYTSSITILPDVGRKAAFTQLSDLASLAEININGGAGTEIYQNLITAESVLAPVIYNKYQTNEFKKPVDLIEYFDVKDYKSYPPQLRERKRLIDAMKYLLKRIETRLDRKTKILTVSVTMPESKLSADVANKLVNSLDNYLKTKTRTYASEQSKYIQKRIAQVKDSLNRAEQALKDFKEKNRRISQSPSLLLKQNKFLRNIKILQSVYIELRKQLELSKIEEVKDTPVLNIREYAKDPVNKTGPTILGNFLLIMIASLIFSFFFYIFRNITHSILKFNLL